jgi:UDP-3-O-[3-hydroxymyristoyl] N-acetylglucosamine deacetylase
MTRACTLATTCTVTGIGLHSGADVRVEIAPAPAGSGRVFWRDGVAIPALAEYVTDTRRSTTLGRDGAAVRTVEHVLAALVLAGIDDAAIRVDGPELPALDGAAAQWAAAITAAGVVPQDGEYSVLTVAAPQWLRDGDSELFLWPAADFAAYAAIDVPNTAERDRMAGGVVRDPAVAEQLRRARTWGLEAEVQALLDAGLARGVTLDSAVVLTPTGYLNPTVWPDEPAWHKALDLVGDLALVGARLAGGVLAVRGGHRAHVALAQRLRRDAGLLHE